MIEYIEEFIRILDQPFMLRAIYGGVLVSLLCGVIGIFTTLKKESFISDGIAHASLAGVAIGVLVSGEPVLLAMVLGVIMAIIITYIKHNTNIAIDSAIGIVYPFLFSIGVLLLFVERQFRGELETFIFGSVVTISNLDILYLLVVSVITLTAMFILYKEFLFAAFDKDFAKLSGINISRNEYILNILTAMTVVVSVKLVGIVLVTALIVVPAAHAKLHARKFSDMLPVVIIHSVSSFLIGIFLSLHVPPGPVIIIVSTVLFVIGAGYTQLKKYSYSEAV